MVEALSGSSPRVRGTHCSSPSQCRPCRFIPARAGNTSYHQQRWTENTGSSPRVRGTHPSAAWLPGGYRFIPARAGNTPAINPNWIPKPGSSPRVRGTRHRYSQITGRGGSSPRVRGTPITSGATAPRRRFIPARAGNTGPGCGPAAGNPVHPRACGEHESGSMFIS